MSTSSKIPTENISGNNTEPLEAGDKPRDVANKVEDKTAPVAGVTATTSPAGGPAVSTGTAYPVAALANDKSRNAGALSEVRNLRFQTFSIILLTCLVVNSLKEKQS